MFYTEVKIVSILGFLFFRSIRHVLYKSYFMIYIITDFLETVIFRLKNKAHFSKRHHANYF